MTEMDLLQEFGRQLDRPSVDPKPDARQHFLSIIEAERPARKRRLMPRPIAGPTPRGRRQPGWWPGIPMVAAVLVGALVIAVSVVVRSGATDSVGVATGPSVRPGVPPATSFAYTRSRERSWSDPWRQTSSGKVIDVPSKPSVDVRETWMSIDGTRDGGLGQGKGAAPTLSFPGCRDGRATAVGGRRPCRPDPAYQAAFPTTVEAARAELYRRYPGSSTSSADAAFDGIGELMIEKLMSPASRAALFEVALSTPGAVRVPGISTVDGVAGQLLTRITGRIQQELLFDPQTHELMARVSVPLLASGKAGSLSTKGVYSQVVLERGVVAGFAVRPDGTTKSAAP